MSDWLRDLFRDRPVWINALMAFSAFMTFIYIPWDIFWKPVGEDQEVWFGIMFTGWWAKFWAFPHWFVYAAATHGFRRRRPWICTWGAPYTAQISLGMLVWNIANFGFSLTGLFFGIIGAAPFALVAVPVGHQLVPAAEPPAAHGAVDRLVEHGGVADRMDREIRCRRFHDRAEPLASAETRNREQRRQRGDVLAMDLDQGQRSGRPAHRAIHMSVDRLHDRALAGAARAPQQGVVGRQPLGEAPRVLEQDLLLAVDAHQQIEVDPVDLGDGCRTVGGGVPDIGLGGGDVGGGGSGRGESVERFDNA